MWIFLGQCILQCAGSLDTVWLQWRQTPNEIVSFLVILCTVDMPLASCLISHLSEKVQIAKSSCAAAETQACAPGWKKYWRERSSNLLNISASVFRDLHLMQVDKLLEELVAADRSGSATPPAPAPGATGAASGHSVASNADGSATDPGSGPSDGELLAQCRLLERVAAEVSRLAFLANKGKVRTKHKLGRSNKPFPGLADYFPFAVSLRRFST